MEVMDQKENVKPGVEPEEGGDEQMIPAVSVVCVCVCVCLYVE